MGAESAREVDADGLTNETISYEQTARPYHTVIARLVLDRRREGTLLDYGCGVGSTVAELERLGGRFETTLVDPDPECLRRAAQRAPDASTVLLDDDLDIDDLSTYDVVLISHVLQYVPEPLELLRALVGRLRPGGFLVLATPNPVTPTKFTHHLRRRRYSVGMYTWDRHSITALVERGLGARVTEVATDFVPLPGSSRWRFMESVGESLVRSLPQLGFSIIEIVEPGPGAPSQE